MGELLPLAVPRSPLLQSPFTRCLPAPPRCISAPTVWEESLSRKRGPRSRSRVGGARWEGASLETTPFCPCRRETLQDVSFTVMPGQTLALV